MTPDTLNPALELSKEYKMYEWVRALLDPTEIVQSPSSAKKHITPPPKFDLPDADSPTVKVPALSPPQLSSPRRTRRSVSPSKKTSPRKSRQTRVKDAGTPGTSAANESLQTALDMTVTETQENEEKDEEVKEEEVSEEKPVEGSPKRKAALRSRKAAAENEEDSKAKAKGKNKTTVSLDVPISLPEAPSTAETAEMIAQAKEMVEDAVKETTENADPESIAKAAAKKRKTDKLEEDEDDETSPQRVKRARVLEDKLKRERVRNRALVGVTAAFALA